MQIFLIAFSPSFSHSFDDCVKWLTYDFFHLAHNHFLILLCNKYNKNYFINSPLTLI